MKRKSCVLLYFSLLCLIAQSLHAQIVKDISSDSFIKKISFYGAKEPASVLFAHFDKNVYANNENVWFTAYLLNYNKKRNNPHLLGVLLVNDHTKSIVLEQKFVMANGLAFGNVLIPDTTPPGDFSFIIYTNELMDGKPVDTFTQPITIKGTSKPGITASITLNDTTSFEENDYRKLVIKAEDKNGNPLPYADVSYRLGNQLLGKVKTDQYGQYELSVPVKQVVAGNNLLSAEITYKKESRSLQIALPVANNRFNIKFYPEGGSLVNSTRSIIGWETKDENGVPVKTSAVLFKDNEVIDTIQTDSYGMGKFSLIPIEDSKYEMRLMGLSDSIYQLPKTLTRGPVIAINKALANDSLRMRLTSKYAGKYYLLVHNYRQLFYAVPVEVGAVGKSVLIDLKDIPKGLSTITVLDSLQRPCAERLFFAHYDQRNKMDITTDKQEYATREIVSLKLKLLSSAGDTTKGMVSVACVQNNRVEVKKANDIESYVYLKHELESLPITKNYMGQGMEDRTYLENILLIRGWRRYKWQDMVSVTTNDTINRLQDIPPIEGDVVRLGKPIKRSIKLMAMTDSAINIATTDKNGHFVLEGQSIITSPGRKVHLLLNDTNYSIRLVNSFGDITSQLIKEMQAINYNMPSVHEVTTDAQILKGFEHAINIREVKITARKEDQSYQFSNKFLNPSLNDCGDYVCRHDILNCTNHPHESDNRAPNVGETYHSHNGGDVIYTGCKIVPTTTMLNVNGVSDSKEFYGEDYSLINSSQPEYQSTIYWKPACLVNSNHEIKLKFYTSDITGPFKIIVQGVTTHDVIYGEKEFNVIKKP